ncbi:hypothetical protein D3C84_1228850 [compost metagenome]
MLRAFSVPNGAFVLFDECSELEVRFDFYRWAISLGCIACSMYQIQVFNRGFAFLDLSFVVIHLNVVVCTIEGLFAKKALTT